MLDRIRTVIRESAAPVPTREIQRRLGIGNDAQRRDLVVALFDLEHLRGEIRYLPDRCGYVIQGGTS